jgi:lipid II:glycine glycyltransferase (peptidoglycan interpeptide bridge formation enzyme)
MFIEMYREMIARKKFREPNDIDEFLAIQQQLPAGIKMKIMLCRSSQGICAGLICSVIGGTAIYLFGATSSTVMKSRGSYLLQWKLIEWLKHSLVTRYDLNGINPETNPGTYKFKSDLAGSKGRDVRFLGQFESCESVLSFTCASVGERLRSVGRALSIAP